MGWGDVKLALVMGLCLGWIMSIVSLALSVLIATFYIVLGMAAGRLTRKQMIPFGPFLALGTVISFLWGTEILGLYLQLVL